jgi:primase-polymerase (primpol)-like protein
MKPPKPAVLSPQPGFFPQELKPYSQWVFWKLELDKDGEWTKVPYNLRNKRRAKSNDPSTWSDHKTMIQALADNNGFYDGVGFMLTAQDPFCMIDPDKCREPETGKIKQWAQDTMDKINSYTEVSPSETGLRIICKAKKPGPRCRKDDLEIYDDVRFMTLTGAALSLLHSD